MQKNELCKDEQWQKSNFSREKSFPFRVFEVSVVSTEIDFLVGSDLETSIQFVLKCFVMDFVMKKNLNRRRPIEFHQKKFTERNGEEGIHFQEASPGC